MEKTDKLNPLTLKTSVQPNSTKTKIKNKPQLTRRYLHIRTNDQCPEYRECMQITKIKTINLIKKKTSERFNVQSTTTKKPRNGQ